jgi:hypothetical protein
MPETLSCLSKTYVSSEVLEDEAQVTVVDGLEVSNLAVDDSGDDCFVHGPVVQVDLWHGLSLKIPVEVGHLRRSSRIR